MAASTRLRFRNLGIADRIYDQIMLPPLVTRVLDTPEMQRLRSLHQLGISSFVFPSATHTRFEHSIGVAHLGGKMLSHLASQQPELGLTEEDTLLCMLAGLLHDVGHGPFSHLFEDVIAKRCGIPGGFSHEEMSNRLAARALKGLVSEEQMERILGLMHGTASPSVSYRDLIANPCGGVDMDRIDYLTRDCVMCFGRPALDTRVNRLFYSARLCYIESDEECGKDTIIQCENASCEESITRSGSSAATKRRGEWRIGFEKKMALSLQELFALRAKLHRSVYQHPVTKAIGHMVGDAMELAAPFFKVDGQHTLMECAKDEELFLSLGDWILSAIESQRYNPQLLPAQQILLRLRKRDIYHKVFSRTFSIFEESRWKAQNWEEAILANLPKGCGITQNDFIVDIVHVHYGKGKRNPVEDIFFFNPKKPHLRPMQFKGSKIVDTYTLSDVGLSLAGVDGNDSVVKRSSSGKTFPFSLTAEQAKYCFPPTIKSPMISSQLFEEHTLFVFERVDTNGVLEKACEKLLTDPSVASLFSEHELPFHN